MTAPERFADSQIPLAPRAPSIHDPMYGPAVRRKRFLSIWRMCGLASMYPASDWSALCSRPPWISARVRSHYRTDLERAIWVTSFRTRREDRSSISSHPLADLGGLEASGYIIASSSRSRRSNRLGIGLGHRQPRTAYSITPSAWTGAREPSPAAGAGYS